MMSPVLTTRSIRRWPLRPTARSSWPGKTIVARGLAKKGDFFIAWQDQRNGNDDIFAVRSYTSPVSCPTQREGLGFAPHPQEPHAEGTTPDQVYLCWGDDTRIDDD